MKDNGRAADLVNLKDIGRGERLVSLKAVLMEPKRSERGKGWMHLVEQMEWKP